MKDGRFTKTTFGQGCKTKTTCDLNTLTKNRHYQSEETDFMKALKGISFANCTYMIGMLEKSIAVLSTLSLYQKMTSFTN
jgi:hypothetical protein